jgi:hypothetical protein
VLVTTAQVADTLRLLLPGFALMKTFYVLGLQTKRSDAQWVIWSIAAAAPVVFTTDLLFPGHHGLLWLAGALAVAMLIGALLALMWTGIARVAPRVAADQTIRAWDNVFGVARWVQVELTNTGVIYFGRSVYAAKSVDTDDLDLYLADPKRIDHTGLTELPGVQGILVNRSQIASMIVFGPKLGTTTVRPGWLRRLLSIIAAKDSDTKKPAAQA